jgi:hypothetical protein
MVRKVKYVLMLLAVVAFVNLSNSWVCGHSVFLAAVSHDSLDECQPHSHGPFEHSHDSEDDHDHEENKVGVKLLATTNTTHPTSNAPVHIHRNCDVEELRGTTDIHFSTISARARSSPPKPIFGKTLLKTIERWLA